MRFLLLFIGMIFGFATTYAQSKKIDSLRQLLNPAAQDSNQVTILWGLAEQYQFFKPDTTLQLAQQAYLLAKRIQYTEGESRSLAVMATGQYLLGNYSAALKNYTQKLKIEEQRNSSRNYTSALNNIGLMYILLADYPAALTYLYQADSAATASGPAVKQELGNRILVNIGEAFFRMRQMDSAAHYFSAALLTATQHQDAFHQGASLLGLGNVKLGEQKNIPALQYYRNALQLLNDGTNNDMVCETALGLAQVFAATDQPDSALHYAQLAYNIGRHDGFLSRQLDAAAFLSKFYKEHRNFDSAFLYMENAMVLGDSLKGQAKTREAMIISSNEQLRQAELAEQKLREEEGRIQQLQVLSICIFIPMFFLLTVALSKVKLHRNVIRFMGVVSLLLVFEFLVLLLHPLIGEITHHNKIFELLILVVMGAGLVPLHHRLERVVLNKLIGTPKDTAAELPRPSDVALEEITETAQNVVEESNDSNDATLIAPEEQKKSASATNATEADQV